MPTSSAAPDGTVQIVVVGDSLTSGHVTRGYPWTTPAQEIFDRQSLPAHILNSSVAGIGYENKGSAGVTFASLVRRVVTSRTDIVVFFGSDNDKAGPAYDKAVAATLALAHDRAPEARIVVVGPPITPAQHGRDLAGLIDPLRRAADSQHATFIDASDWFAGAKAREYLSSDNEHPNVAGERYLGRRFAAILEPIVREKLKLR